MIHGRCQGCGRRELLVSFRGRRCLSCVCMSSEYRGDDQEFDPRLEKHEPTARSTARGGVGPRLAPRGRMSPIAARLAMRMREDGMSLREIGRQLGVSKTCVGNSLRKGAA